MPYRNKLIPGSESSFSKVIIQFPSGELVQIFPKTKRLILEDGVLLNGTVARIIDCRVGQKLQIIIDNREEYQSFFDVYRIFVEK